MAVLLKGKHWDSLLNWSYVQGQMAVLLKGKHWDSLLNWSYVQGQMAVLLKGKHWSNGIAFSTGRTYKVKWQSY